jgi:CopG family nickel-responsive transcriptional regulator
MQRVTISMAEPFADELDRFIRRRGYVNRSEALRDLARIGLDQASVEDRAAEACVATLAYVQDERQVGLARRLQTAQREHHDLAVANLGLALDHDHALQVNVLRGPLTAVTRLARWVMAQRGVRHAHLNLVPVDLALADHGHVEGDVPRPHIHSRPIV